MACPSPSTSSKLTIANSEMCRIREGVVFMSSGRVVTVVGIGTGDVDDVQVQQECTPEQHGIGHAAAVGEREFGRLQLLTEANVQLDHKAPLRLG